MEKIQNYQELIVWQEAMNLAEMTYAQTKNFPKEELYGIVSQIRRAAVSIPANIAEGYGRKNRAEYLNFLSIAAGSLTETETHLLLSKRIGYLTEEQMNKLQKQLNVVGKLLMALRKSLSIKLT
ncbi:MAG: four helix bundle protein [Fibromonadaceae bacterium]|jgi:four helix bundle protein|nr:four helix bundle protein [Fibromonadaceae bacterium]